MAEVEYVPRKTSGASEETLTRWRTEIFGYYVAMKEFNNMDPSDLFRNLSQFTARASEMRARIALHENKVQSSFRIKIIDPFIEECERQFKIHSRILSNEEMIARLAGGRHA